MTIRTVTRVRDPHDRVKGLSAVGRKQVAWVETA